MARKPRFFVPEQYYHVIQRGNNKGKIFFDDLDHRKFIKTIKEAKEENPCEILSYCLMNNHFHLLMSPIDENSISKFMKYLGVKYVQYVNKKYNRTGTLWEGRYKSFFIEEEKYLSTCLCYIEMNPVKAKVVNKPEIYRWSSYTCRAYGYKNPLITLDPWYESLGRSPKERQLVYRRLISSLALGSDPSCAWVGSDPNIC